MIERMADIRRGGDGARLQGPGVRRPPPLAFRGLRWRPPAWLILRPAAGWLPAYERRLDAMLDLPAAIVQALELTPPEPAAGTAKASRVGIGALVGAYVEGFAASRMELLGSLGIALIYIASGSLLGGLAAFFAWLGLTYTEHWMRRLADRAHGGLGLLYGVYAVCMGLSAIYPPPPPRGDPLALRGRQGRRRGR